MRKILENSKVSPAALEVMQKFHPVYVKEVEEAIQNNEYVVVGMKQNPVVSKARKILSQKNITFKYIEHGSYLSKWKERLAIKLWAGWPTFPMVFVNGQLIGGCRELVAYLENKKN